MSSTEPGAGRIEQVFGYFTQAIFLHGQTGWELERRIGYHSGMLKQGWLLAYLLEVPRAHEFELRGYSQLSNGIEQGNLPENRNNPNVEEIALQEGSLDVEKAKFRLSTETFTVHGAKRLAKVVPLGDLNPEVETPYPQGSGIPQWTLKKGKRLRARIMGVFGPDDRWTGGYA
ncbi:MAG: hypothetical protein AB8B60_18750 [Sulfitobacter sp.]